MGQTIYLARSGSPAISVLFLSTSADAVVLYDVTS